MKLSIIIPIYNAAEYLHDALSQLLKECGDSQVILVNDGSTDKSGNICREFSQIDNRVKVINQPNCGPGAARNSGLQCAVGEWIYFMDADDSLCQESFEFISQLCDAKNVDLQVFGFRVVSSTGEDIVDFPNCKFMRIKFGDYLKDYVLEIPYGNGFLWNKLYRRDIIIANNLRFDTDMRIQEDEIFNLNYLRKCRSIELHSRIIYNYNLTTPSNSRTRYLENYFECIKKVHNSFEYVFNECHVPVPLSLYSRTLQAVMVNELMFYFLHYDNNLSYSERCNHLKMIGDADIYKQSVSRIKKSSRMPVEWCCYHQAIKKGSMTIFMFWHTIFSVLRRLKHTLSR